MQTVVVTILMLGVLGFLVKLSMQRPWMWAAWAVLMAVGTGLAWPLASAQSKTQIADFLQSPTMMADASVLITLEVALMLAWCVAEGDGAKAHLLRTPRASRLRRVGRILLAAFPGLVVFLALFALLTQLMFALTGVPFARTSWLMAAAVLLLVPLLAWAVGKVLPERTFRLEMLFALNLLMGGLGVVATVNGRTAVNGTAAIDWPQLLTIVVLCLGGLGGGLLVYRRRQSLMAKRRRTHTNLSKR